MCVFKFVLGIIIIGISLPVEAYDLVSRGKISYVENGWLGEGIAIHHTVGTDGCPAANTEYAISEDHPSYKELVAIALSAFATSSDVQLIVQKGTCIFGSRTKVISIRLIK